MIDREWEHISDAFDRAAAHLAAGTFRHLNKLMLNVMYGPVTQPRPVFYLVREAYRDGDHINGSVVLEHIYPND